MAKGISSKILKQIRHIGQSLFRNNFLVDSNATSSDKDTIVWDGFDGISDFLKNASYIDIYDYCVRERAFNFKLIDGGLIQLMYQFRGNDILMHRLAYYPSPYTERYLDNPEEFEEVHFGRELSTDALRDTSMVIPIRFDFDRDKKKYVEHYHCQSHLTLGNHKDCRIPVSQPVSPFQFILKNFYQEKFKKDFGHKSFNCDLRFDNLLSDEEKSFIHVSL